MTVLEAILFGLVQGLTEFIPISSTAHMVILGYMLEVPTPGLTFEIFLHLASLLAVLIYFRRDLVQLAIGSLRSFRRGATAADLADRRMVIYLLVATVITGGLGLFLMESLGDSIKSPTLVGGALLVTATLLVVVERAKRLGDREPKDLRMLDAILIGLAQTIAVIPGVSRSGSTLIAGLALGLNRETAVRFSFLLSIPVLAGSSILAFKDIAAGDLDAIGPLALGVSFLVSFLASIASIVWLIRMLKQQRLYWFSVYLVLMAIYVFVAFPPDATF
jgi:undecaprenyl-diphosphatase